MRPPSDPWNQRVDRLPTASGSAVLLRSTGITQLHADFSDSDADGYGIPFDVVGASTARSHVEFDYADESDALPYPIPSDVHIEGGGDRHAIMVDRDACTLYELFALRRDGDTWHAGSGAIWDLRSSSLRPAGWTSADAAGLPILPGLARYDDIAAGGIDHALRITIPRTQRAYLWPARHVASSITSPSAAPMGLRIRVKASFATASFPPQTRAVLEAGKRYGFVVADNGSAGYVSGAPSSSWDDDDLHALHDVPANALEVVDTSALPRTPPSVKLWNLRWQKVGARTYQASAFASRAATLEVAVPLNPYRMLRRRFAVRQGFVQVRMPYVHGGRYTVTAVPR